MFARRLIGETSSTGSPTVGSCKKAAVRGAGARLLQIQGPTHTKV